ncbi:baculoviral IAP repeat-containing protein 2-like [Gigantopelta aegis]|uniref:baculoviral IAP repeat-containing protein 2-like n=1 Tax=Gigantopelta aegis TaxID=1735272 RepID=UPI001B888E0E|nr:baculoviral IAP repeat-containing protein 2-like [Gigantopelta aegis]XP_041373434.1 baculoviral IAP repeat-containing protein 2-like [Gigantopelta aegis]
MMSCQESLYSHILKQAGPKVQEQTNASDHVVQKVMNMGFSKEQISVVTAKHGGKVFDVADLIEAILVLEQEESSVEVPGPENYQPNRTTQYNMSGNEASTNLTEQLKSNPNSSLDSAAGGSVTEKPNADLPSLAEGGQAPESGSERNHQTRNDKGRETSMDVLNKQSHFDNQKSADAVTGKENCQMDEIRNENLHLKTQRMCRRCRLEESVMLCLPCGHIASCVDCIGKTDKCFVCSTKILGTVRTYLA